MLLGIRFVKDWFSRVSSQDYGSPADPTVITNYHLLSVTRCIPCPCLPTILAGSLSLVGMGNAVNRYMGTNEAVFADPNWCNGCIKDCAVAVDKRCWSNMEIGAIVNIDGSFDVRNTCSAPGIL